MDFDFAELFENPAFIILAGGGIFCEVLGYIASKKLMEFSLPVWQLLIMMVVTVIAAAFFANRD
jgi:hypothetical protein